MVGREKEIVRHLSDEDLGCLLSDNSKIKIYVYIRLVFLKLLYDGATLAEAGEKVGKKKQEIQRLLAEEFDVEYHPHYLPTFLDDLGLSYAIPRTKTRG
jgi:hypothetical protein